MHSICDTVLIPSDEIPRDLLRDRKIIRFRVVIRFGLTPLTGARTMLTLAHTHYMVTACILVNKWPLCIHLPLLPFLQSTITISVPGG